MMVGFRRSRHPEDQLSAFLDGELNPRARREVERHLAACESCSALLGELQSTKAMLAALPPPQLPRSFVLGGEHAKAPTHDLGRAGAYPKRSPLTLIPAVALTVFLVVLVVDLSGSTSSDSSDFGTMLATKAEESRDASEAQRSSSPNRPGAPGSGAGPGVETPVAGADPGALAPAPATGAAPEGFAPVTPEPMTDTLQRGGTDQAPADGDAPRIQAAEESDSGPSLLLILEVLAGAVFLASGFYLLVWPRLLSRGGS